MKRMRKIIILMERRFHFMTRLRKQILPAITNILKCNIVYRFLARYLNSESFEFWCV